MMLLTRLKKKTKVVKTKPEPVDKTAKCKLSELTGKNDVANPAKKTKLVKAECDPVKKHAKRKQSEPVDDPPAKRSILMTMNVWRQVKNLGWWMVGGYTLDTIM